MTWFKLDDKFHSSEPVRRIPREIRMAACGLFAVAGTWSADHLKDGFVPAFMLDDWGASVELADALVKVGLWRKARNGYRFREWSPWQPTRAEIELNRAQERDRKKAYRASRQQNTGDSPGSVPVGQIRIPDTPSRPVPSRPVPTVDKTDLSVDTLRANKAGKDGSGNEPVDNTRPNLDRIHARLEEIVPSDTKVERMHAAMVADEFLARAPTPPRMATAYVLSCITRHANAVVNFIQTDRWSE
jgi:hypothetical protein